LSIDLFDCNVDVATVAVVFDGVGDKVVEHHIHFSTVRMDRDFLLGVQCQGDFALCGCGAH
jgi:hypothetical protein